MQVSRRRERGQPWKYLIVVHVMSDYAFAKYFKAASTCDMELFRGMFLHTTLSRSPVVSETGAVQERLAGVALASGDLSKAPTHDDSTPQVLDFGVLQAFLPKFENEGQDTSIADAIEASAGTHYMAVSIKHSGSLCTLSHELVGAKNSIQNRFSNAGLLALYAHYKRCLHTYAADLLSPCTDLLLTSD